MKSGILYVVATPIGNLSDITRRAEDTLKSVEVIVCEDTRVTGKLLSHLKVKGKKKISLHQHSPTGKVKKIADEIERGCTAALVTDAGTPGISDPGRPLIKECIRRGIKIIPVPGPSAVLTALMVSGADFGKGFVFAGYLPSTRRKKRKVLEEIKRERRPVVVFESPHRILETLKLIQEVMPERMLCLSREMTKIHEEYIRGRAEEVMGKLKEVRGEITLVFFEEG